MDGRCVRRSSTKEELKASSLFSSSVPLFPNSNTRSSFSLPAATYRNIHGVLSSLINEKLNCTHPLFPGLARHHLDSPSPSWNTSRMRPQTNLQASTMRSSAGPRPCSLHLCIWMTRSLKDENLVSVCQRFWRQGFNVDVCIDMMAMLLGR